ncbi:S41 family peptidase [Polaribacter tangerinus]|uniref:S41 family peptidase n=1 Tax=Polaribacter tangerinus TaxID=1920034 RepID=UPI000B4A6ABD|nr:S41 family peptidase [Polaribacter tangerinus]
MKKRVIFYFLTVLMLNFSCEKKEEPITEAPVSTSDEVNHFIWKGLNLYYLWNTEVTDLADDKFKNVTDLYSYFKKYSSPEETFNSLLNKPGIVDRFSWIVDDYVALENSFQGINITTGMDFGLRRYVSSNSNIYGYVRYVIPNSSAESLGIKRGMIFNTVNGIQLTDTNYNSLLFGNTASLDIGFANFNNGNPLANNTFYSVSKTEVQENPIAISKIINVSNKKIGYLLYNQFASAYDQELNAVFNTFKSNNIDDLIIDLRYNGGGSTTSASYLASMITGQFTDQVFTREVWNDKVTDAFSADSFTNNFVNKITTSSGASISINSLELPSVYFIVSASSASASELIINALDAYIDVKVVGTQTVGKQVGSITLYDSDNLFKSGANLNSKHSYAMQPLVFEIKNKNNKNYPEGIIPETNFTGINMAENIANLGELGNEDEPLLARTIQYITTGLKGSAKQKVYYQTTEIYNSKLATPANNTMYKELKEN